MKKTKNILSEKRLKKYLFITEMAIKKLKVIAPQKSFLKKIADDYLTMATAYYSDAVHFYKKKQWIDAFACVNYAHGWLDAGARLGIFDVSKAEKLFTV